MAKNYVQTGEVITYKNTGTAVIPSGAVVVMGAIIGIAVADIPVGDSGSVHIEKVWGLPKDTAAALAVGDKVYWDKTGKEIVAASSANTVPAGVAAADASASAGTVNVKINA